MAQSEARLETLWAVPKAMLQDPLWLERDAYDSAHYLMVVLHAAYAANRSGWIAEFEAFFERFAERRSADGFDKLSLLNRSQFLYLVTEYLALNKARGNPPPFDLTPLIEDVRQAWMGSAWLWAACGPSSFLGMAQRLEWKLARPQTKPPHCRAIFDEEWYAFVNAANLVYVLGEAAPPFLREIVALAYRVLEGGGVWNLQQTRWLWQPGVWAEHPDFAYAGWSEKAPGLTPKPVPGISPDTSHLHRLPLWLRSLERAYRSLGQAPQAEQLRRIQRDLAEQFTQVALVAPSAGFPHYRTTNFLDGNNGLYRYRYQTQAAALGFGPYELSGTLLLGWWAFLPSPSTQAVYCHTASAFPLSEAAIGLYLGPDTTRARHPQMTSRVPYSSGLLELIARLACGLQTP